MKFILSRLLLAGSICLGLSRALGQGTAFTYQGQLNSKGCGAMGSYDLQFSAYDGPGGGNRISGPLTNASVGVTNGFFDVMLDFGADVFGGAGRWLEIAVRTNGVANFTVLSPRQPISPTPYSIYASRAAVSDAFTGTIQARQVSGTLLSSNLPVGLLSNNQSSATLSGSFSGSGAGLTNVPADYFNPANYGAVGDGQTDDTTPMLKCVAAANLVRGGRVNLMGRTFRVDSMIELTNFDMELYNGAIVTRSQITSIWAKSDRPYLHDLTVGGPGINYTPQSCGILMTGPRSNYVQQPKLQRVFVTNFWTDIYAIQGVECCFEDIVADAAFDAGVHVINCDNGRIMNITAVSAPINVDLDHSGVGTVQTVTNCIGVRIQGGFCFTVAYADLNYLKTAVVATNTILHLEHVHCESYYGPTNWPVILADHCTLEVAGANGDSTQGAAILPGVGGPSPTRVGIEMENCNNGWSSLRGMALNGFPHLVVNGAGNNDLAAVPSLGNLQGFIVSWYGKLFTNSTLGNSGLCDVGARIFRSLPGASGRPLLTVQGGDPDATMQWGADTATSTLTPGVTKTFSIRAPSASGNTYDTDLLYYFAYNDAVRLLNFGRNSLDNKGLTEVNFWCSSGTANSSNCLHLAPNVLQSFVPATLNQNLVVSNGIASYCSNNVTPVSIPLAGWTNTWSMNANLYIQGIAFSAVKNGVAIVSDLTGMATIPVKPGQGVTFTGSVRSAYAEPQ